MRKSYAEETNHVVVGEVLEVTPTYLKMRCRAFHFKRPMVNANIVTSEIKVRLFPWQAVAYVTELPESLNWERAAAVLDAKGDVVLTPAESSQAVALREGLDS
jgi:hypothetical protein